MVKNLQNLLKSLNSAICFEYIEIEVSSLDDTNEAELSENGQQNWIHNPDEMTDGESVQLRDFHSCPALPDSPSGSKSGRPKKVKLVKVGPLAPLKKLCQERVNSNIQELDPDIEENRNITEPAKKGKPEVVDGYEVAENIEVDMSHPQANQGFLCNNCMRTFGNKGAWTKHTIACGKIRKTCGKKMKKKITSKGQVTCLSCQIIFSSYRNLRKHKDEGCQGSNDPPYICNACSTTFSRKSSLSSHLKKSCPSLNENKSKETFPKRFNTQELMKAAEDNDAKDIKHAIEMDNEDHNEDNAAAKDPEVQEETQEEVKECSNSVETNPDGSNVFFCLQCPKKGLTEEEKEIHVEETGHSLDPVRLPDYLTVYV